MKPVSRAGVIAFFFAAALGAFLWYSSRSSVPEGTPAPSQVAGPAIPDSEVPFRTAPSISSGSVARGSLILIDVPFTAQAPFANWDDERFQEACEEASILMAMRWVEGRKTISSIEANAEILKMVEFETARYGEFRDTSAADTARLMRDYFGYQNFEVKTDIGAPDIIAELAKGNIVITPMNGRKLPNPYYTPPGPLKHMMVVRGYDPVRNEFITNDPGTRRGEGFRYRTDVFEAAIQDYPTGNDAPILSVRKPMIVVSPKSN